MRIGLAVANPLAQPSTPTALVLFLAIRCIGPIAALVWVERDIRGREMHRRFWGGLVFAMSVIGLGAYLVARAFDELG